MKPKTRISSRLRTAAILQIMISAALPAQSGRGWLKGLVLGTSDSQGMGGAVIELSGDPDNPRLRSMALAAQSDDSGRYLIKAIPYGDYTLKVSMPGFIPYEAKLYIPSDAETQLHIRLRKERNTKGQADPAGEAENVRLQFLRFQQALSSKDAASLSDLYTAEAVSLLQNQPLRKGRESIAARWKQAFGASFSLVLTSVEIVLSPGGRDACQYGTFEIHGGDAAGPLLTSGKWAYIWRKEPDQWRIALEMDNFDASKTKTPASW
jgi:ketosteroid isomerase-like protein